MTRRDFFKTLLRLLGLAALPAAASMPAQTPRLIQRCALAGFEDHDGEELWRYLTVGDSLELQRESGATPGHDAIRVDWLGRQLGYLPPAANLATMRLLDRRRTLHTRIAELKRDTNLAHRMAIEIWLVG